MTQAIPLYAKQKGEGENVILLHGLFGSLSNLGVLGNFLSREYKVHWLDVRNHGQSPHADEMDFPAMAADVFRYMDENEIVSAHLIGHSMGGKIAMQCALSGAERIQKLIVIDIAPVLYPPRHDDVFAGFDAIDLSTLKNRQEAETILAKFVEHADVRSFLLKNLTRSESGNFCWRMNLQVIKKNYDAISDRLTGQPFNGTTLFIKGGRSPYLQKAYRQDVLDLFPQAQLKIIEEAGHWLHAEKPDFLNRMALRFLSNET